MGFYAKKGVENLARHYDPALDAPKPEPEIVRYLDLKKINARFLEEFEEALRDMLADGRYIGGKHNERFCREFAEYCGLQAGIDPYDKYAVGVGNGLDALRIILQAADLGPGDEVIVPANTFIATILAISQAGCTPVLVEPDPDTFNIDPVAVEKAITPKTKAIMPVHLYGRLAPMDKISNIAWEHGLKVFEDAAQAHGAKNANVICGRAGSLSDAAGFSFYPGKNLGCLGDGGMIVSRDKRLICKAAMIANYGSQEKYNHKIKGCNSRLDDFQAAVLSVKLGHLDADNERRREIAKFYNENITNQLIKLPQMPENPEEHVWHIYAVRVKDRNAFREHMERHSVETLVHYPVPPHRQGAYPEFSFERLPVTEAIHREVVSLPLNQVLTDKETARVVEACNAWKG